MQSLPVRSVPSIGPFAGPLQEFDTLVRRLGDAFDRSSPVLDMRMDVEEDDDRFLIEMDIPGVSKEDIDISVAGNVVTVRASSDTSRRGDGGRTKGKKLHTERVFGESVRSFSLPLDVDPERTTAAYEHGVLSLVLPKRVDGRSRHIHVT